MALQSLFFARWILCCASQISIRRSVVLRSSADEPRSIDTPLQQNWIKAPNYHSYWVEPYQSMWNAFWMGTLQRNTAVWTCGFPCLHPKFIFATANHEVKPISKPICWMDEVQIFRDAYPSFPCCMATDRSAAVRCGVEVRGSWHNAQAQSTSPKSSLAKGWNDSTAKPFP